MEKNKYRDVITKLLMAKYWKKPTISINRVIKIKRLTQWNTSELFNMKICPNFVFKSQTAEGHLQK